MHNLHKWGKSKSTACRLCGDPDETAGHAMLACPALSAQHTSRHHRAGRIILAAIEAGATGAPTGAEEPPIVAGHRIMNEEPALAAEA
jgi:hypothetical protein